MSELIYSVLPNPKRPIVFIMPEQSIADAIYLMKTKDIGALVVSDSEKLYGILSERDIVRACTHATCDFKAMKVKDALYAHFSTLDINDPIEKAMQEMTKTKRRHLLIMDKGSLAAMLSIGDILFYLLENKAKLIEHLRNYIAS